MNRGDFQTLAEKRLADAQALLRDGQFEGAYYLAGYAVECALKACIAKKTQLHDFPDKKVVNQVFTHNLASLLRISGLDGDLQKEGESNPEFSDNWEVVKDWSEESRYVATVPPQTVRDLYSAIGDSKSGVLTWLKKFW
jgi:hypothetical protein